MADPAAPVAVGDTLPDGTLTYMDKEGKVQEVGVHSLLGGKKAVLLGVPGAFTPTCSLKHVPGFIDKAAELKASGVEEIVCLSVNDAFVMGEWAKTFPNNEHVMFLADGSATYTRQLGLQLDLTQRGMGVRCRRFALLVDNLVVKVAKLEQGGEFTVSNADEMLLALKQL